MIVSASYRTDIPAYYGDWFVARMAAGHADVRNPYGGRPNRVALTADAVSGFVFWTRNPAPFDRGFQAAAALGRPMVVQFTLTGYPRALEPGVLETEAAVRAFHDLSGRFGRRAVVWRYDPVVLTAATPAEWHVRNIDRLATALAGATDECALSFAHIYRKTRRNLDAAGLAWRDPPADEKRDLLKRLAEVVAAHGLTPTLCAQPDLLTEGLAPAACIDAGRLADVGGAPLEVRTKGNRPGCLCAESRDIGRYDSCAQGCAYCYANQSRAVASRRLAAHDAQAVHL